MDQVRASQFREIHQVLAVVVPSPRNDARLVHHLELLDEELPQVLRHRCVVEESHVIPVLPPGNALLHFLEQGLREVVVHVDFRIPRHFDGEGADGLRLEGGKQAWQTHPHHIIEEDHPVFPLLLGQNQKPVEVVGQLQQGKSGALGDVAFQFDSMVNRPVLQLWHPDIGNQNGHQVGAHFPVEVIPNKGPLVLIQLCLADQLNALGRQLGFDLGKRGIEPLLQFDDARPDAFQRLVHPETQRRGGAFAQQRHALQGRHPDPEELVEVVGEDAEEPHPLNQRHSGVLGFLQDPLIEREPTQLAVEELLVCREGFSSLARRGCPVSCHAAKISRRRRQAEPLR